VQLTREREAGRVFLGFNEGTYAFRPTFKVYKRKGVQYNVSLAAACSVVSSTLLCLSYHSPSARLRGATASCGSQWPRTL
jgi:hypothetical protein